MAVGASGVGSGWFIFVSCVLRISGLANTGLRRLWKNVKRDAECADGFM